MNKICFSLSLVFFKPLNRDLVRRDLIQAVNSSACNLVLKLCEYFYNDGTSKELLCLCGTVICHYKGNRYNIRVEIWLQPDHPNSAPLGYVKPTTDMYVSPTSKDVQPDGTIVIPYLKSWRHVILFHSPGFLQFSSDFVIAK